MDNGIVNVYADFCCTSASPMYGSDMDLDI